MIRFQRVGRTNDPAFRIAVLEKERAAQAGNIVELLGTYNPRSKALTLNEAAVKEWMAKGAQPTGSVRNLLITKGVIEGKKINVLPKKISQKKDSEEGTAPAASAPVEDSVAPELPTEAEVVADAESDVPPAVDTTDETPAV